MKLGTQPRNIHPGPSARYVSVNSFMSDLLSEALIIRVLMTSTGEHTVVARKPAKKDALKCVAVLSGSGV